MIARLLFLGYGRRGSGKRGAGTAGGKQQALEMSLVIFAASS